MDARITKHCPSNVSESTPRSELGRRFSILIPHRPLHEPLGLLSQTYLKSLALGLQGGDIKGGIAKAKGVQRLKVVLMGCNCAVDGLTTSGPENCV